MSDSSSPLIAVTIVEDDPSLRQLYAEWIEQAKDFQLISVFENGHDALKTIPNEPTDVVLMDINLPGADGVECVRTLKPQLPDVQFVMITVYDDSDRIFHAFEAGATGYLSKQTPRVDLLTSLREVHQGGSPMSSGIARKVVQFFARPSPASPENELSRLSTREEQVLDLLAKGFLYKEISDELGLSKHTVDTYLRRIYEKLHVHSRAQATARYTELRPRRIRMPAN